MKLSKISIRNLPLLNFSIAGLYSDRVRIITVYPSKFAISFISIGSKPAAGEGKLTPGK